MKKILVFVSVVLLSPFVAASQTDSVAVSFDSVQVDTATINVFEQAPNATFKLDYYHTDGYSNKDRYWYEIIIIDSLLILNFQCAENDDWDFINYQKQLVLDVFVLDSIKKGISDAEIRQKKTGIPRPPASGYGADRLYIESSDLNLAGGAVYLCIGDGEDYEARIKKEKQLSTTISGDFEKVFKILESLFTDLPMLLESKNKLY